MKFEPIPKTDLFVGKTTDPEFHVGIFAKDDPKVGNDVKNEETYTQLEDSEMVKFGNSRVFVSALRILLFTLK